MQAPPNAPYGQPQPMPPQGPPGPGAGYGMTPGAAQPIGVSPIESIRFVFSDPDSKMTILFGLIFLVIPLVGPIALAGYFCEVQQRLVRKHPRPLPKLDFGDFGSYIGRGLKPFLVGLIVGFPLAIVYFISYLLTAVLGGVIAGAVGEPVIMFLFLGVFGLFALGFGVVANVLINAAQTRAELTEDVGKSLQLGKVWAYGKATWVQVLIKTFLFGLMAFGIVLLGMLACFVGIYPAIVVVQIASVHLRWQIYNDYLAKGGEPIELAPQQQLPSEAAVGAGYAAPGQY